MSKLTITLDEVIYLDPSSFVTVTKGVLHPSLLPIALKQTTHPSFLSANQSIREAFVLSRLSHPSICSIYDCYLEEAPGGAVRTCIITELLPTDAHREITRRKYESRPWTEAELMAIGSQVCDALSYAQASGVSHRDIKPQNLFMDGNMVKIGDFGSAASLAASDRWAKTIQGSPMYFSPELQRGYMRGLASGKEMEAYNPFKSDVYSLGVTLVHMAGLRKPEELAQIDGLENAIDWVLAGLGGYPKLQEILRMAMKVDPEQRPSFSDLKELMRDSGGFGAIATPVAEETGSNRGNPGGRGEPQANPPSVCSVCTRPKTAAIAIDSLPSRLMPYIEFAGDCCSLACLSVFVTVVEDGAGEGGADERVEGSVGRGEGEIMTAILKAAHRDVNVQGREYVKNKKRLQRILRFDRR